MFRRKFNVRVIVRELGEEDNYLWGRDMEITDTVPEEDDVLVLCYNGLPSKHFRVEHRMWHELEKKWHIFGVIVDDGQEVELPSSELIINGFSNIVRGE